MSDSPQVVTDYTEVQCPHCGQNHGADDGPGAMVTYWGEDGPVELWCSECDKPFWVKEAVLRSFTVAKDRESCDV